MRALGTCCLSFFSRASTTSGGSVNSISAWNRPPFVAAAPPTYFRHTNSNDPSACVAVADTAAGSSRRLASDQRILQQLDAIDRALADVVVHERLPRTARTASASARRSRDPLTTRIGRLPCRRAGLSVVTSSSSVQDDRSRHSEVFCVPSRDFEDAEAIRLVEAHRDRKAQAAREQVRMRAAEACLQLHALAADAGGVDFDLLFVEPRFAA